MKIEFANKTPAWCPGCGDFSILETLKAVFKEADYNPHDFVLVSGIGQAAKLPHYIGVNVFNGLHGRALPAATGIKIANHKLEVIITSGDGDMYGEGGNHLLHAMRRNIGVKVFVHNNQVYGLTKGQASPTSDPGFVTPIQTHGVKSAPVNPLVLAIVEECSFVARSFSGSHKHLAAMMRAAIEHKNGMALLDILQPCVSFNHHNTFGWYKERVREIPASHDPRDKMAALELAMQWGDEIPIGIFYRNDRKSFEADNEVLQKGPLVSRFANTRK